MSLDELVAVAETFEDVAEIKPAPVLTEDEAVWVMRLADIARECFEQSLRRPSGEGVKEVQLPWSIGHRSVFLSLLAKANAFLSSIDSQVLERAREERWYA